MRARSSLERLLSKAWVSRVAQVLLFVCVMFAVTAYQTRKHLKGEVAPNFVLKDLAGDRISLHEFRGKKVLLHFFATWCSVCRLELPSLNGLSRNLGPDEVLLAVVEDSDDVEA